MAEEAHPVAVRHPPEADTLQAGAHHERNQRRSPFDRLRVSGERAELDEG